MIKPADARAIAPVVRFARFDSCGSEDDEGDRAVFGNVETMPADARKLGWETCWRRAFNVEK